MGGLFSSRDEHGDKFMNEGDELKKNGHFFEAIEKYKKSYDYYTYKQNNDIYDENVVKNRQKCGNNLIECYIQRKEFDLALPYSTTKKEIYVKMAEYAIKTEKITEAGDAYLKAVEYASTNEEINEYCTNAIENYTKMKNYLKIASIFSNIAKKYEKYYIQNEENYLKTAENYAKAVENYLKVEKHENDVAENSMNAGIMFCKIKNEKAREYLVKAGEIFMKTGQLAKASICYANIDINEKIAKNTKYAEELVRNGEFEEASKLLVEIEKLKSNICVNKIIGIY